MIRILIVDDHPIVRSGLRHIVANELDMEVVAEAGDYDEAVAIVKSVALDVVILDIAMPGRSGVEILTTLKQERPSLPVIVLSVQPVEQVGVLVLRNGASAYLVKDAACEQLVEAIRHVRRGRRYITPELAERLADTYYTGGVLPHERLSSREIEVLRLIAQGTANSEIARLLCVSAKSVTTYRARILHKMGMSSNAEIVRYAMTHQLAE